MARQLTSLTAPAITSFNSLASSTTAAASSAAITVGTSANVVDHLVQLTLTGPATMTATAATMVNVFVYGSADGTVWAGDSITNELVDGTDKAIVFSVNGKNALFLGTIPMTLTTAGTSTVYKSEPFSIASVFGGILPAKYVVAINNAAGAALPASGHSIVVVELSYT